MKNLNRYFSLALITFLLGCSGDKVDEAKINKELNDLKQLSEKINNDFSVIGKKAKEIALFTETLYENPGKNLPKEKNIYAISPEGVMFKTRDDGNAAVFVSGIIPVNETIKEIVYFTEPLDSVLKSVVQTNSSVVQSYYNDKFSYNRIYPFMDVLKQYEPKMNIPEYNFYYLADRNHNPGKKEVWVDEPYVDPAGRGWMVSAIAPVYFKDSLQGVIGLDVTVKTITDKYFSELNKETFIVDNKGTIVAADEFIIKLLQLPELKDHKYFETIKADTYRQEDFNLLTFKNRNIRTVFSEVISNKKSFDYLEVDTKKYAVYSTNLNQLNWFLIKIEKL